jgi:hypothetical protein
MGPTVKATAKGNGLEGFKKQLAKIAAAQVYVGVPEDKTARTESAGAKTMTNAGLVYLFTNGSPLAGQPGRPIIEPAIEEPENKAPITQELRNAARSTLDHRSQEATQHLNKAGMLGRNAAIRWFTDPRNHWAPNAASTIKRKGSDKPGIDTGEMRRAMSYLVEQKS